MTEPAPQPAAPAAPLSEAEDKQWASFAHFGNILFLIAPLIIWLIFKDRGTKTNVEGKEAVNWGINVAGLLIANVILGVIFGFIPVIGLIWALLGTLIWIAIIVLNVIFAIMGGIKVNGGGSYRYPLNIRWIK
jgi:uncharacterized Tic20 family protein